jgi:hypothetical protein
VRTTIDIPLSGIEWLYTVTLAGAVYSAPFLPTLFSPAFIVLLCRRCADEPIPSLLLLLTAGIVPDVVVGLYLEGMLNANVVVIRYFHAVGDWSHWGGLFTLYICWIIPLTLILLYCSAILAFTNITLLTCVTTSYRIGGGGRSLLYYVRWW